jgi:adenosine/AMP kinase
MITAFQLVESANTAQPNSIFVIAFLDAKRDEIMRVFQNAPKEVRTEAVEVLLKIDPNNSKRYNDLLKG